MKSIGNSQEASVTITSSKTPMGFTLDLLANCNVIGVGFRFHKWSPSMVVIVIILMAAP